MIGDPIEKVRVYRLEAGSRELIPVLSVSEGVAPVDGLYLRKTVDLGRQLIKNPESTFIADVTGDAMCDAFIPNPARLIIDRSEPPCSNDIVLARVDGAFLVRRYVRESGVVALRPENAKKTYPSVIPEEGMDFEIWGVVTQILVDPRLVFFHDCTS